MTSRLRIGADDFELFGLPTRFAQDRAVIDARWKALQTQVHPDQFVTEGPAVQQVAMQWALRVNEAYRRLKQPLDRAAYLCQLNGHPPDADGTLPAPLLMQQMAWHEALDDAHTQPALDALAAEVALHRRGLHDELAALIDQRQDWSAAAARVRALMFVERFADELDRRLDAAAHGSASPARAAQAAK